MDVTLTNKIITDEFEGKIIEKNPEMENDFIESAKKCAEFFQAKVERHYYEHCPDGDYLVIRLEGERNGVEALKKFLSIMWKFVSKPIGGEK